MHVPNRFHKLKEPTNDFIELVPVNLKGLHHNLKITCWFFSNLINHFQITMLNMIVVSVE